MEKILLDDILKRLYELEGLVLVAQRENSNHDMLIKMLKEKMAEISSFLSSETEDSITPKFNEPAIEEDTFYIRDADDNHEPVSVSNAGSIYPAENHFDTSVGSDLSKYNEAEDIAITKVMDDEILVPGQNTSVGILADVSDDDEDVIVNEHQPKAEQDDINSDLAEDEDDNRSQHDSPDEPQKMTFDYKEPQKVHPENENKQLNETVPPPFSISDTEQTAASLTVDTLLQRNMSRDLKKAFTINDHFRFRRELFSNSDVEMNDALNLVEAMQSYDEAEEYFYDTLKWDKQSPDVIDFMAIICNHFYSK